MNFSGCDEWMRLVYGCMCWGSGMGVRLTEKTRGFRAGGVEKWIF